MGRSVWADHIKQSHPEISLYHLARVLGHPDEVWRSHRRGDSELYYLLKSQDRRRYWMVVVKSVGEQQFVATAMTRTTISGSKQIYQRERR